MKKLIIMLMFLGVFLYAENFSEMSNQELISIMGYVDKKNQKKFEQELKSRLSTMSKKEKTIYKENLKKMKK